MAIASTFVGIDHGPNRVHRYIQLTISGNYTTGGDTWDLTPANISNANFINAAKNYFKLPDVYGILNEATGGYYAEILPGTLLNNWKIKWYTPGGSEVTQGAYPAALTSPDVAPLLFISHVQGK